MNNMLLLPDHKIIFLFRHGMTEANEKGLYCGKTDLPLSKKGETFLRKKKEKNGYPDLKDFKIITSSLKRTSQSLGILYPELLKKAEEKSDFNETDFGDFEMKSYEELKNCESYKNWVQKIADKNPQDNDFPCPNGESYVQMKGRVLKSLEILLQIHKSIAIFTHGGVISVIMEYFFPDEKKSIYEWSPDFGGGYKIMIKKGIASFTAL